MNYEILQELLECNVEECINIGTEEVEGIFLCSTCLSHYNYMKELQYDTSVMTEITY